MNHFRKIVFPAILAAMLLAGPTPAAMACCGDGAAAAAGATAAGATVAAAIGAASTALSATIVTMTTAISNGFANLYAEIEKQTAAIKTFEEGNAAVQSQLVMEKARADAQSKYELSPRTCFETAGGAAATVAEGEVQQATDALNQASAQRTLFTPNTTAAVANIYDGHVSKYCSQQDANLGRCSRPADPTLQNADVRADATLNTTSYTPDQLAAAQAFVANVTNPIPTQDIPQGWEKSEQGKMFIAGQYIEQARASVAANSLNAAIAERIPVTGLGSAAMMNTPNVSEMDLMESQVRGRFESPAWYQMIASFSLENLLREADKMQALKLWMDLKSYHQMERIETVLATQLAMEVKRDSEQQLREARVAAAKSGNGQ